MYFQIRISEEDIEYQRIVWRNSPTDQFQDYKLNKVTFGTAQLSQDEATNLPIGSRTISHDFSVDGLMSGADTVEEAKVAQGQIINILKAGGFQTQK